MAPKPNPLKRPVPTHVVNRLAELAQRQQALNEQIERERGQLLTDFAGITGIDLARFGLWVNDDEQPPTYEVLTKADFERRQRLKAAVQQPQPTPKADPHPRKGENPLPLAASGDG